MIMLAYLVQEIPALLNLMEFDQFFIEFYTEDDEDMDKCKKILDTDLRG